MAAMRMTEVPVATKCENCDQRIVEIVGMWSAGDGDICWTLWDRQGNYVETPPHEPAEKPETRPASKGVRGGNVITVSAPPVMSMLAALDRAEGIMREETRGWCADCDEAPANSKCFTHQSILDEADLLAKLRAGIQRAGDSELAVLVGSNTKGEAA